MNPLIAEQLVYEKARNERKDQPRSGAICSVATKVDAGIEPASHTGELK